MSVWSSNSERSGLTMRAGTPAASQREFKLSEPYSDLLLAVMQHWVYDVLSTA